MNISEVVSETPSTWREEAEEYEANKKFYDRIAELVIKLKNAEELKRDAIGIAELEIKKNKTLKEENEAIRALMNIYNIGGWTDAVCPMKRALEAEAHEEKVVQPLVVEVKGFQCPECFQTTGVEYCNSFCHSCGVKFNWE